MKIPHISTADIQGGAARASYRLVKGLRTIGEDCSLISRRKTKDDAFIHEIPAALETVEEELTVQSRVIQEYYIDRHRTEKSNTLFSLACPGFDLSSLDIIKEADVINLHWIIGFQSVQTIASLLRLGKPVVWTLHDQWPFTGGCHYSAGCANYRNDCASCPQLSEDPFSMTRALLQDKAHAFKDTPLTVVTPSRWLAQCARESAVFRTHRVETIPNSLETDMFIPKNKKESKAKLGINPLAITLMIGAENGKEIRKGYSELIQAVERCRADPRFYDLISQKNIQVLIFGHAGEELVKTGLPVHRFGYVNSDELLSDMYSAADFFILPSLEDNLPNTMLESMSCGTPVIAFNGGGMQDVIVHELNGLLVPLGNTEALARAILSLLFDPQKREDMGRKCRSLMAGEYSLEVQARNYKLLYQELIDDIRHVKPAQDHSTRGGFEPSPQRGGEHCGSHLLAIYNNILLKALKESLPDMIHRLKNCEDDRAARLAIMHEQGAEIGRLQGELNAIKESKYWKLYSFARNILKK